MIAPWLLIGVLTGALVSLFLALAVIVWPGWGLLAVALLLYTAWAYRQRREG